MAESMKDLIALDRPIELSIIIPTFNNVRYTAQTFASLARASAGVRYEIIIVDNGSTDETLSFVGSHTPGQLAAHAQGENPPVAVHLLHNTVPRALAHSWNMGIDAARGKHLLICNNDVIFTVGALREMITVADGEYQAGIVFPVGPGDIKGNVARIIKPETPADSVHNLRAVETWGHARNLPEQRAYFMDHPYPPQGGYCFLLTRRCWERIGRFDEGYELTGEDWDYFARTRRTLKLVRATHAYVEHYEHVTCKTLGEEYSERMCRARFRLTEQQEGCMELFSIVMPVYNRVDSLEVAIDSVLAQSFPHWRLYVIDDGSGDWDRVAALAHRRYSLCANRIWFFHRQKNAGPAVARNYGLTRTQGKYVAFLDSDDIWYPDHLAKHFAAHENGNWAMIYSRPDFAWRHWDPDAKCFIHSPDTHPSIRYFGPYDQVKHCRESYIQTSSVTLWGDLARDLRFPDGVHVVEDWEYFKAASDAGGVGRPVLSLPDTTCRYHIARAPHEEDHRMRLWGALSDHAIPVSAMKEVVIPFDATSKELDEDGTVLPPVAPPMGVVIPTRNRPAFLRRALDSALGSSNVPVCVVDDGSSDRPAVARAVLGTPGSSMIRVESIGASAARNRGVAYLPADWIQFLDDDDILVPAWDDILRPHLVEDADIVICQAWIPGRTGFEPSDEIFTSQICVRRSVFLRLGGFLESCSWAEEREMVERLQRQGARVVRVAKPIVFRAARGGSGDPASRVPPTLTARSGANGTPAREPMLPAGRRGGM